MSPAQARSPSCEPVERLKLKNGIEVLLAVDTSLPLVAVVSSVHAGSRHDPPGYEGLAHYVEHLSFRAAPPFASALDLYAEAGATGVNASTRLDTTDYYALMPASQLERALWIEARRLAIGLHVLDEQPAIHEREVVLREYAWRYDSGVELAALEATYHALFPPGHPYHITAPSRDSTERLTLGDARWFFAEYYRPERVRLAVVGDFDLASVKRLIERDWAGLTAAPARVPGGAAAPTGTRALGLVTPDAECRSSPPRATPSASRIVVRSRYRNERLELYWPVAAEENAERWRGAFRLFAGAFSSAAQQTGVAHTGTAELVQLELAQHWMLGIDVVKGQPFEKVEPLVWATLKDLRESVVDEHTLSAERQASELSEHSSQTRLYSRALNLVRRECVPSTCESWAKLLTPNATNGLDRFSPSKALIVEWRHDMNADDDGSIETLP